jgi:hypothetical protein
MVIGHNYDEIPEFWTDSEINLVVNTLESGALGPFTVPAGGDYDNSETYWLIGCMKGAWDDFIQIDLRYSSFPPNTACTDLYT